MTQPGPVVKLPESAEVPAWVRRVRVSAPSAGEERLPRLAAERQRWEKRYALGVAGLDAAFATLAAVAALFARFGTDGAALPYRAGTVLWPVLWVAVLAAGRAYDARFLGNGSEEYRRVFDSAVRLLAVVAVVGLALQFPLARSFVLLIFPLTVVLTLLGRRGARSVVARARGAGHYRPRVLLVGRERALSDLLGRLAKNSAYQPVGVCVDSCSDDQVEGVPVVGSSSDVVSALLVTRADTVAVAAWSDLSQQDLRHLSWQLEGTGVDLLVAPSLTDIAGPRIAVRPEAGVPLLHIDEPRFDGPRRVFKRLFDVAAATAALVVLSPLLLMIGMAVRLDSKGPALFRQTRVGHDGRTFMLYKFRSMVVDADQMRDDLMEQNEAADGLLFKVREDPRVTRVGKLLRRFSLDELPQFLNVALGSMSLVGPRPPLPDEVSRYGDDVRRRLLVRPGLTGLWQVSGRSDLPWDEAVQLDLHYVENWSPMLDLMILWRTGGAVLARRGAY